MDIHETSFKEDLEYLISNFKKLLPRKKEKIVFEPNKLAVRHLSNIHVEAKNVFPKCFHGAKVVIQNPAIDKVTLLQQYNFGNSQKSHRAIMRFLQKETAPKHVDDGLLIDTSGSATATYTEKIKNGEVRLTSGIKNLTSSETEVVVEHGGERYNSSTSFNVKNVDPTTFKVLTQWIYQCSLPNLYIGGELGFKPFSSQGSSWFSTSWRFDLASYTVSSTISVLGMQVCVFKELAKDLRIASIVSESVNGTTVSLALHKHFNDADLKLFVDSLCCAGVTYQRNLFFEEAQDTRAVRMKLSALIDRQGRFKYGIGFNLDF